jgi:hypothetical protein
MRTWDYWTDHRHNGNPIDIPDYNAIGTMAEALSRHADEAFAELSDRQKLIAERLFKGLTEKALTTARYAGRLRSRRFVS